MGFDVNALIAVVVIISLLYLYLTRNYGYWSKRGIPTVANPLPGFGHTWQMYAMLQNLTVLFYDFYKKGDGYSMIGFYDLTTPGILIRDPELVKSVLATNFDKFPKNVMLMNENSDPILANALFSIEGDKWKSQRAKLTRVLSAAKLKIFFSHLSDVCDRMNNFVESKIIVHGTAEFEMKRLFARYTSEIVANLVFGIEGYSFDDNHKGRSFLEIGETVFVPSTKTGVKNTLTLFFPFLSGIFDVRFLPKDIDAEFRQMIHTVVDMRLKQGVVKNDILQNILESKKTDQIDENYVVNQAGAFFVDMYETTGITMTFVAFQLANNLEVQSKVRDEIRTVLAQHNDTLTYEMLKDLTYMDQVINESARLYTVLGTMSKVCTEKFELVGRDGLSCTLEPGNIVSISVQGLHYDSKYWSDPQIFDPERFAEENKNDRHRFVHLPFGEGPRMCPGRILGIMMLKLAFVKLLNKYVLTLSTRTKMPLQLDFRHFLTYPDGGVWVDMEKIV